MFVRGASAGYAAWQGGANIGQAFLASLGGAALGGLAGGLIGGDIVLKAGAGAGAGKALAGAAKATGTLASHVGSDVLLASLNSCCPGPCCPEQGAQAQTSVQTPAQQGGGNSYGSINTDMI